MCSPSYHHNGFVTAHTSGHMMHGYALLVPMKECSKSAQQAKQGA